MTTYHTLYQYRIVSVRASGKADAVKFFNDNYSPIYSDYTNDEVFCDKDKCSKKDAGYVVKKIVFVPLGGNPKVITYYAVNYTHATIITMRLATRLGKGCTQAKSIKSDGCLHYSLSTEDTLNGVPQRCVDIMFYPNKGAL